MNSTAVATTLALAGLATFWPSLSGLASKLKGLVKPALPVIGGGDLISRDAAVAGLLTARDYAHGAGRHDTCHALEACLPGLVCDQEHDTEAKRAG